MNKMKTLTVVVEQSDNNYSAYIDGVDGIVASGNTVSEIKENMYAAIEALREDCQEFGGEFPQELEGEFDLVFKMDVRSVLDFYSGIFTKSGLERITGINQKQLWHYASGNRKPRPEQTLKLERALHKLGAELMCVSL